MVELIKKCCFVITLGLMSIISQVVSAQMLAGRIWLDVNEDGIENDTEPGISNINVSLFSEDMTLVSQQTSHHQGNYQFENLTDSNYLICLESDTFFGYGVTWYQGGNNVSNNNDLNPETGCTGLINTQLMSVDTENLDIGLINSEQASHFISKSHREAADTLENQNPIDLQQTDDFLRENGAVSSLAGRIWLDSDGDGWKDIQEPSIGQQLVTLYDEFNNKLSETIADNNGEYEFSGLPFSNYIVCLGDGSLPVTYRFTLFRAVNHEEFDNDGQPESGCTPIYITNGHAYKIKNIDFGLVEKPTNVNAINTNPTDTRPSPVPVRPNPGDSPQPTPIPAPLPIASPDPVIPVQDIPTTRPSPVPTRTPVNDEQPPQNPVDEPDDISNSNNYVTRIINRVGPGEIKAVPGSQLDFIRSCPSATDIDDANAYLAAPNYKWNFYCAGAINAENGAAFDSQRNRMIVWGGGHADYAGNEVYAFNLEGPNPGWERLNLPSPLPEHCDMRGTNYCPSVGSVEYLIKSPSEPGKLAPAARHTLDTIEYIPDLGEQGTLWSYSGSVWQGGFVSSAVWMFDTAQLNWTEHTRWNNSKPDANPDINARPHFVLNGLDVFSVYDPTNGTIYAHGNRRLKQYNPRTDQWSLLTDDGNVSNTNVHSTAAYDWEHKKLVVIGGSPDYPITPSYYDLRSVGLSKRATYYDLVTVGDNEIQYTDAPGLIYEPDADVFVAWSGGRSVYVLDMESNPPTWEKVLLEGDDPGRAAIMGTFGRMRYVPDKKVMMLVNRVALKDDGFSIIKNQQQANVYFFRLPARFYKNSQVPGSVLPVQDEDPALDNPFQENTVKHLYPQGNIADALYELIPGDTLIIHQGEHFIDKFVQITAQGTPEAPVIIKAAEGEERPVISTLTRVRQNTFSIGGRASHITIKGLEITNGNHEDGVKLLGEHVSHITLEDLHIHHVSIGVRVATDADHVIIRNNHIHDTGHQRLDQYGSLAGIATGEGMYLGCHRGTCSLSDSVIENNLIHDVSPLAEQGDGIEMKTRSHDNVIRNNVVYNMGSRSYGGYGGILVWGWADDPDTDSWNDNIVEGNVVWGNVSLFDVGIEAISHAVVRNNIVFNVHTGLASNPQFNGGPYLNIPVNDVNIVNNTVAQATIGTRLNWDDPENAVFANNIVHSNGSYAVDCRTFLRGTFSQNMIKGPISCEQSHSGLIVNNNLPDIFQDPGSMNFWLQPGAQALIGQGASQYAPADDFNGSARNGVIDIGAYQTDGASTNPGWIIQQGQFKQ